MLLFGCGLIAIFGSSAVSLSGAGPLGCLTTATVAAYKWRLQRQPGESVCWICLIPERFFLYLDSNFHMCRKFFLVECKRRCFIIGTGWPWWGHCACVVDCSAFPVWVDRSSSWHQQYSAKHGRYVWFRPYTFWKGVPDSKFVNFIKDLSLHSGDKSM